MERLERILAWGGVKRDVLFLVLSAAALGCSIAGVSPVPFDMAWVAIVLCGVPILLEAVIGLVTAFDIKADVLVSLALVASVVIGDAKGTSANYAYILTAATSEELRDGTSYWTFDAVMDGTIQTLTVASKFTSTINDLKPGHVQELRFNGEYVSAIKDVPDSKI